MNRYAPNEAACPVELEMLGLLLRSPESRVSEIVGDLDETQRSALAVFCYQRSHMRAIGILVATRCSERALRTAGGLVGEMLIEHSRAGADVAATLKPRISLARAA